MRFTPLLCLMVACGTLQAQNLSQSTPAPSSNLTEPLSKTEQPARQGGPRVERIRVEDSGARVDEVRYGGVTQSITVQPSANVPSYEVLPSTAAQAKPGHSADIGAGQGVRVWKFFNF